MDLKPTRYLVLTTLNELTRIRSYDRSSAGEEVMPFSTEQWIGRAAATLAYVKRDLDQQITENEERRKSML